MQDQELTEAYKAYFKLTNAPFERIEHEDTIIASVYKVQDKHGNDYILKISPKQEHYKNELYFLNYFNNKIPVPKIIDKAEPTEILPGAILMEYLLGNLLTLSTCTKEIAFATGSLLAHIHSNKALGYGDLTQQDNLSTSPEPFFVMKFEEGLTECGNILPETLIEYCRQYLANNIALLSSVDGPCITHRDFRPGNIIIREGQINGVIDWAGARAGFAEEDFCPLALGEWSSNDEIKESFLKAYSNIRPLPNYIRIMPLLCLSRAIAIAGFAVRTKTWNTLNENLFKRSLKFIEDFFK